jgi:hypothetical protein
MDRASFSLLAQRLGCPEHATPEEEVTFLRGVDAGAILGCFRVHNDSGAQTRLFFRPQVDGVVLFSPEEQAERARQGKFARVVSEKPRVLPFSHAYVQGCADIGPARVSRCCWA